MKNIYVDMLIGLKDEASVYGLRSAPLRDLHRFCSGRFHLEDEKTIYESLAVVQLSLRQAMSNSLIRTGAEPYALPLA